MTNRPPAPWRPVGITLAVLLLVTLIVTLIAGPLGFVISVAGCIFIAASAAIVLTVRRDRRQEL